MSTVAERVAKGVALLDERRPGWWQDVDPETLKLASPCDCVLGQLWNDGNPFMAYSNGKQALGLDWPEAIAHGFDAAYAPGNGQAPRYGALTAAWRRVITERRAAATS